FYEKGTPKYTIKERWRLNPLQCFKWYRTTSFDFLLAE
ncbi:MAG: hypothetical protein ACI90V_007589, partial [Bacillariaceae sp.]